MSQLNERQKAFADYYIETLNATEAAKRAGYSEKTAKVIGAENLTKPYIQQYIQERLASKEKERIASQDEVLEFLTSVMRGEVKDQMDFDAPVKDRNKAAELLGKRYALFADNMNLNAKVGVKIVDDVDDG
jgi:phage terminase small subunit